jgi:DNA-binding PadR family transcriptional regulator
MFYDISYVMREHDHRYQERHGSHRHFHHPRRHFDEESFHPREGDLPGGRKLSSEDLQLVILALLAEKPAHGYELMKAISEYSSGFYTPSPGVIYPALMYLHEIGYAKVDQDGTRKLYGLTPEGKAHLDANQAPVNGILEMLSRIGGRMQEVRDAFAGVHEFDSDKLEEIHRARNTLKAALKSKRGCGPEEASRIAKILDRAALEIMSGA